MFPTYDPEAMQTRESDFTAWGNTCCQWQTQLQAFPMPGHLFWRVDKQRCKPVAQQAAQAFVLAAAYFCLTLLTGQHSYVVLQVLLQNGRLKAGHKQQPLRSKGESGGAFVVISGIVRVAGENSDGIPFEDSFLGAGLPAPPHLQSCTPQ